MKKVLILFLSLFLFGCGSYKVSQKKVFLHDYTKNLDPNKEDINLTNPPEDYPPIECICPHWFGLKENPCFEPKKTPKLVWQTFSDFPDELYGFDALIKKAKENDRLIMVFYSDGSLFSDFLIDALEVDECFVEESWKHYYLVKTKDLNFYYYIDNWFSRTKWLRDDYLSSPSVMVLHDGVVLPIVFETPVWFSNEKLAYELPFDYSDQPSDLCTVAKAFYEVTR